MLTLFWVGGGIDEKRSFQTLSKDITEAQMKIADDIIQEATLKIQKLPQHITKKTNDGQ